MNEWTAFLRARLDEKEAAAKAAQAPSPWKAASDPSDSWIVTDATGEPLIYDEGTPSLEEAAHIALNDPGRALREVEAGRAILARYVAVQAWSWPPGDGDEAVQDELGTVVRHLAAVWSVHPDYRPEWKP